MSGGDGPRLDQVEALGVFGAWTWNVPKNELTWSAGLRRILGLAGDTPASFETWLSRVHRDDLSTVKAYFTRLRKEHGVHAIEYRLAGEPVRTIYARARSDADGVVHGVDQDITLTKETAARVVFSDRMVSIGTLAGGVAHEINNPLAIISANLQLMADAADREPALVDEALRAVERIRTIVRGLTAFSRSTDNDQRRSVDLARVLDLACSLTGGAIRHRAKFTTELGPVPWVRADEARLGQVFINLLVNAMEAVPEGTANQEVALRARTDEAGWAIVEVSDTGGGIPSDVQPRVFDPFFTTKPVGQGTGLGLSICHGIVRSLGGDITFSSIANRGTTFSVALPPGETPAMHSPRSTGVVDTGARRGSILIVDDEALFASSLRRLLAVEHEVTLANSGREALDLIRSGSGFDAILCDLMMPEMTGAELHAALIMVAPEMTKRMVFITGGAFSPASQEFLDRVTNRCFEKPCDIGLLRAVLRALVDTAKTG